MDIMFEIVSRQKFSADFATSHLFGEAGGLIGRSEECDWVLPDRGKQISRKHALITYFDGSFHIEDISSNGVYLSLGKERLERENPHRIEHGDGFIIGDYTIMARLMQNPGAYTESAIDAGADLLAEKSLALDPLEAMDQEEEMIARQRLGNFNDILGTEVAEPLSPSDHNDPRLSHLTSVNAEPDEMLIRPNEVDPWNMRDALDVIRDRVRPEVYDLPAPEEAPPPPPERLAETDDFFRALGFAEPPDSPEERQRILALAADIVNAGVEGLTMAMQNRAECKKELRLPVTTTSLQVSNNPLQFSPTPQAALATMLGRPQKGVMTPGLAVRAACHDLHSHHMGLLAGARAAVRGVLEKISPNAVQTRLDINGPVRMGRTSRLWHTFIRMYHAVRDDHEGFAGLFLNDFARAYEVQVRTLSPLIDPRTQGDRK